MSRLLALFSFQYLCAAHLNMIRVLFSMCVVPAVISIIVTDPPPTSPEYNYSYNIVDPQTGDTKSLFDKRRGDVVTGSYSVIDPDGTHRILEYTSDSSRGFNAFVRNEPLIVSYHHAVPDPYYFNEENTHFLNEYYPPQPSYREHLPVAPAVKPISNQNQQKTNNDAGKRKTKYFTPLNEIKNEPVMPFKSGEHFAPNN